MDAEIRKRIETRIAKDTELDIAGSHTLIRVSDLRALLDALDAAERDIRWLANHYARGDEREFKRYGAGITDAEWKKHVERHLEAPRDGSS